jgi:hypothetical protein
MIDFEEFKILCKEAIDKSDTHGDLLLNVILGTYERGYEDGAISEVKTDMVISSASVDSLTCETMSINEAIRHCEEVASSCQHKAYNIERDDYADLCECAAEHRQLAKWLRELKELRSRVNNDCISRQAAINECNTNGHISAYELEKLPAVTLPLPPPPPTTTTTFSEEDLIEIQHRFGEWVRFVVEDILSNKRERWKLEKDLERKETE